LPLDVFTQRNFVADFIRLNSNFIHTLNSDFELPFEGVRGNVRTSSIARWKARGRLLIRDIDPNELVLTYGGLHLCVKFGENRQRNATVRVMTYGQTDRQTDR